MKRQTHSAMNPPVGYPKEPTNGECPALKCHAPAFRRLSWLGQVLPSRRSQKMYITAHFDARQLRV